MTEPWLVNGRARMLGRVVIGFFVMVGACSAIGFPPVRLMELFGIELVSRDQRTAEHLAKVEQHIDQRLDTLEDRISKALDAYGRLNDRITNLEKRE